MPTVIDSLIVTLGLDPKGFKKGQQEADKSLTTTRKTVVSSADAMGKAVTSAARQFALAFLGFQTASGVTRMLTGLFEVTRQLGFVSKNTDTSAAELRNWSQAAKVAGGSADGFLSFIQEIQKQESDVRFGGVSGWNDQLNALRVNFRDLQGNMKPALEIAKELGTAFDAYAQKYGRPLANNLGLKMGISQDTMNFLLMDEKKRAELIERQRSSQFQINDGMVDAANRIKGSWEDIKGHFESFALALLQKLEPTVAKLLAKLDKWLGSINLDKLSTNIGLLVDALGHLASVILGWLTPAEESAESKQSLADRDIDSALTSHILPTIRDKELQAQMRVGNQKDPGLRMLQTLSGRATFGPIKGLSTPAEIANSFPVETEGEMRRYLDLVKGATGKTDLETLAPADYDKISHEAARRAIELGKAKAGAGTTGALFAPNPTALQTAQGSATPARLASTGGAASNRPSSSTEIGSITINTAATDAGGIAGSLRQELNRRLISQANYGMA